MTHQIRKPDWEDRAVATLLQAFSGQARRELAEVLRGEFDPAAEPELAAERDTLLWLLENPGGVIEVGVRYTFGRADAERPVATFDQSFRIDPRALPVPEKT